MSNNNKIYKTPYYNRNRTRILLNSKLKRDNRTEEQIENDRLYQSNYYYMVLKPKRKLERLIKKYKDLENINPKIIRLNNPIKLEFN